MQGNRHEYIEGLEFGDNQGHFIIYAVKEWKLNRLFHIKCRNVLLVSNSKENYFEEILSKWSLGQYADIIYYLLRFCMKLLVLMIIHLSLDMLTQIFVHYVTEHPKTSNICSGRVELLLNFGTILKLLFSRK